MPTRALERTQMREEKLQRSGGLRDYPAGPGVLLLLLLVVLLVLPEIVRHVAVRRLEALVTAPVAIADVDLNLFTGRAQLSDLVIGGRETEAVVRLPTLDMSFSRRALLRGEVVLHSVTVRRPELHLERTGPRRWNLAEIFRVRERRAKPAGLTIETIQVEGGQVTIVDRTTDPVVTSRLRDLTLVVSPVPLTPEAEPGELSGEVRLDGAPVRMNGTVRLDPFVSRLKVESARVPAAFFRGYLEHLLGTAGTVSGELHGRLDVTAAVNREKRLVLELSGLVEGRGVSFGLPGDQDPLFHASRLTADPVRASNRPRLHAELSHVELSGATVRVERNRDGTFDLRQLWAAVQKRRAARSSAAPTDAPAPLAIRHLEARDSRIILVDATVTPSFTGELSDVTAEVDKPSPDTDRASLRLRGSLGGSTAPIDLKGWFTVARPFQLYVEGTVQDYELSRVNPYAEKYVRHRIRRGRVTTEVKYRYDAGKLAAGNEILIRRIKLGDPIGDEFQQQVGIPLKLALALLEGLNGEIRLRVPVEGDLENPEVRLNSVVWKAVRNAVFKALTASFRLLGQVLTVGGKITEVRIDPIGFQPGSLKPDPGAINQLERLATFLRKRPKIELQLRGQASRQETKVPPKRRRRGKGSTGPKLRKLAEDRARFIERALVRRGVARKRLFIVTNDPRAVKRTGRGGVEFRVLR
ncbi:MAG: DUF748 domain-containing protein [Candidatus Methylomirabilia bacterium]